MKKRSFLIRAALALILLVWLGGCATQRSGCPAHSGDHHMVGY
jgi:hypothetical protein